MNLFQIQNNMDRKQFNLIFILASSLLWIINLIHGSILLILPLILWYVVVTYALLQRLNDLDRNKSWAYIMLIPGLNIIFLVTLMLKKR